LQAATANAKATLQPTTRLLVNVMSCLKWDLG
jgi:hypothetical protein